MDKRVVLALLGIVLLAGCTSTIEEIKEKQSSQEGITNPPECSQLPRMYMWEPFGWLIILGQDVPKDFADGWYSTDGVEHFLTQYMRKGLSKGENLNYYYANNPNNNIVFSKKLVDAEGNIQGYKMVKLSNFIITPSNESQMMIPESATADVVPINLTVAEIKHVDCYVKIFDDALQIEINKEPGAAPQVEINREQWKTVEPK